MNVPDIAWSTLGTLFSMSRREILEQFDLVSARRFDDGQLQLGAFDSGDLFRNLAALVRAVRKFETQYIAPKHQGTLEIRNCNAGVIGGDDAK